MIHDALRLLVNHLNRELGASGDEDPVTLGNIAATEGNGEQGSTSENNLARLVLSVVNITEDETLKNGRTHRIQNGRVVYENRPVSLYLYLLFSANHGKYTTALKQLSRVIELFQANNVFTVHNLPDVTGVSRSPDDLTGLRLVLELNSLSFEQINYLWGSLGGKQVPFVLYRARLVRIRSEAILDTGTAINEIVLDARHLSGALVG
ncbi:MAG TPA: DUF4255 domain-containing protein [Polyangiaceae bacterium]|nr:DUF4255 domain-containing protein [Polyangiaceae bacterium]